MKIILGISGASGVHMGACLLRAFKQQPGCEVHLVVSSGARRTWELENHLPIDLLDEADYRHANDDLAACISSGSFVTDGMVILPCSMKTLSEIVHGHAASLMTRAADVCLKERRKLVLCPREMPLGTVHLANMLEASRLGCVIMPPMLTFYNMPPAESPQENGMMLQSQIEHLNGKILMQFGLAHAAFRPWGGA